MSPAGAFEPYESFPTMLDADEQTMMHWLC